MLEEEEHCAAGDQVAADGRGEVAADGRGVVAAEGEGCCWLLSAAAAAGPRSARARSPSSPYPSNLEEVYPQEVGPGCTFGRMMLLHFFGASGKTESGCYLQSCSSWSCGNFDKREDPIFSK